MTKWIGHFGSKRYGTLFISGDIEMQLPDNLNIYPVEASYAIVYKGLIGGGAKFQGLIKIVNETEMKITIMGNKIVTFTINDKTNKKISGNYVLNSPGDNGLFELFPQ